MACPLKEECLQYWLPKETFTNTIYKILFPVLGTLFTAMGLYAWNEITERTTLKSDVRSLSFNQDTYLKDVMAGQKELSVKLDKLLASQSKEPEVP